MKDRRTTRIRCSKPAATLAALLVVSASLSATPANRLALKRHFGEFLPERLNDCSACHVEGGDHAGDSLKQIPHNAFGKRLRELGETAEGEAPHAIGDRIQRAAREDSDGDGVDNLSELLLGSRPGDSTDAPTPHAMETVAARETAFLNHQRSQYPWRPFEPVKRPAVPAIENDDWARTRNAVCNRGRRRALRS